MASFTLCLAMNKPLLATTSRILFGKGGDPNCLEAHSRLTFGLVQLYRLVSCTEIAYQDFTASGTSDSVH